MDRACGVVLLLCLLAACGPDPTPLPVGLETPTPEATPTAAAPRYALAANTQGYVDALDAIGRTAQIEPLTEPINEADLGTRYEVVAAFGDFDGWQRSPTRQAVLLRFEPPAVDSVWPILARALDLTALAASLDIAGAQPAQTSTPDRARLRADLANAGWPDGFDLTLDATDAPGGEVLATQLRPLGVQVRLVSGTNAHARLIMRPLALDAETPDNVEASDVLLYTLPISYRAVPGLNLTFTPDGWPLVVR